MASCPISSAKTLGRYLRASAARLAAAGSEACAAASALLLGAGFGALFSRSSTSAMDGQDFHAKAWARNGRRRAPGTHYNALRRGGRLDEQPAKRSLGLLPSGPDPVGEARACCQPPIAVYRGCWPLWQPDPPRALAPSQR